MPRTHIALLRGINVGGKHVVPMKDLASIFAKAGCTDVSTYIQSGNVIFAATPGVASGLAGAITVQIKKRFGFDVPVILRTSGELAKVISNNPFLKLGAGEHELHVVFFSEEPSEERVRSADAQRYSPDEFRIRGREIYLRLPNGMGRSKLANQFLVSRIAAVGTARNWRTVTKLLELMQA